MNEEEVDNGFSPQGKPNSPPLKEFRENQSFDEGDKVEKIVGDYIFRGEVVARFRKIRSAEVRYVVENQDGILHIFSARQLRKIES